MLARENNGNRACPCCGNYTLSEPEGSYEICPVCYWEDDPVQAKNPDYAGGANESSLNASRENYRKFGACEERYASRRDGNSEREPS